MLRKLTILASLLFVFGLMIATVGCDSADKTVNSDSVVLNDDATNHDPPDYVEGSITIDSLNVLARARYEEDLQNGTFAAAKTNGWVFNINMPSFYSQIEPVWKNKALGYNKCGNSTIGRYGCHLCCVAMMYAKWGYSNLKPPNLDDWSHNGWSHYAFFYYKDCGDLIQIPQALEYPAISRDYSYYPKATGYDKIYTALSRGWPVIIEIAYGTGSHFMVIYAFDGARYWVLDPLRPPGQGAISLWGTGYNSRYIKSIRIYGHHL